MGAGEGGDGMLGGGGREEQRRVGEEAVVQEGGLEREVREAGEEVPDVEDAEVARGGAREEVVGGEVGG